MPAHWTHMQLAGTLLSDSGEWRAPDWAEDPAAVNALLHGALGPDMGYFPGADLLLGELAHYVRPGLLAREMVRRAESAVQQAYAWGWATHLIADVDAHTTVVNPRCGELVNGSAEAPTVYAESPGTHLAVELGLDASMLAAKPNEEFVRLQRALERQTLHFIQRAYRATYDVEVDSNRLLRSHRAVVRFQPFIFNFTALMGRQQLGMQLSWGDRVRLVMYLPVRWLAALTPSHSLTHGATHPDLPPTWVTAEVDRLVTMFPARFSHHLAQEFRDLLEVNVDTGKADDPTYPYSARARERLERRRR